MNKKGQSILAEHVMIFFVVVAAIVAMTTYIQRGLEARIHDARNFVIDSVMNSSVCDANCAAAAGNITYEYEPYYTIEGSLVQNNGVEIRGTTNGNPTAIGVKYLNYENEGTVTNSSGCQLPPECADPTNSNTAECQC